MQEFCIICDREIDTDSDTFLKVPDIKDNPVFICSHCYHPDKKEALYEVIRKEGIVLPE
ncbi:hypothetical protein MK079_01275 [Candidatus Gracilibacteria bacterium]|nr:hypothetical protein [Candidatus Gracilibacteria bacterium]